jgi:hypothetical protein
MHPLKLSGKNYRFIEYQKVYRLNIKHFLKDEKINSIILSKHSQKKSIGYTAPHYDRD